MLLSCVSFIPESFQRRYSGLASNSAGVFCRTHALPLTLPKDDGKKSLIIMSCYYIWEHLYSATMWSYMTLFVSYNLLLSRKTPKFVLPFINLFINLLLLNGISIPFLAIRFILIVSLSWDTHDHMNIWTKNGVTIIVLVLFDWLFLLFFSVYFHKDWLAYSQK